MLTAPLLELYSSNYFVDSAHFNSHSKKTKILKWFQQTFAKVTGDDQLLQLDEFKRALQLNGVCIHVCCVLDETVDDRTIDLVLSK